MSDRREDLADGRPSSDGWTIASFAILLGVVLTSKYLLPRSGEPPDTSPPIRSRIAESEPSGGEGRDRRTTSPSEIPLRGWTNMLLLVYANTS
jgi:hypothetical protein